MAKEEGDRDRDAMAGQNEEHARSHDELLQWAHGRDVVEVEERLRDMAGNYASYLRESDVVIQARVMSDARWGLKHPGRALALAWRFRHDRPPQKTLKFFLRPRFAG